MASDVQEFPPIYTEVGDVFYVPFVANDGRVGYAIRDHEGREEFIYFNPSQHDTVGDANVFVYQGVEGDPVEDTPVHFYNVLYVGKPA